MAAAATPRAEGPAPAAQSAAVPAREALAPLPLPRLVAQVYEASAPEQRVSVLAHLLRPLGALALVAVADGVFAKIRFRSGWEQLSVRAEDLMDIRGEHIVALVHHVSQVSFEVVEGLAGLLDDTPAASGTAAALLVAALVQRSRASPPPATAPAVRSLGP